VFQAEEIAKLPLILKVALGSALGLFVFDVLLLSTIVFSGSFKIDPGIATFTGAIIGLCVIAWQTGAGFKNLIRSQENQSKLEREARLHQAEIEQNAKITEERWKRAQLLSALRSEIVYLLGLSHDAQKISAGLVDVYREYARRGTQKVSAPIPRNSFDAPVYKPNISNLGLLGVSLGADVVTVLSFADGKTRDFVSSQPVANDFIADLYEADALLLKDWGQDLFHVAMRIRATEEENPDPGTLRETEAARRAGK